MQLISLFEVKVADTTVHQIAKCKFDTRAADWIDRVEAVTLIVRLISDLLPPHGAHLCHSFSHNIAVEGNTFTHFPIAAFF
jgi:hypothetical protein